MCTCVVSQLLISREGGGGERGNSVDNAGCAACTQTACGYIYMYQVSCILSFPITCIDVHTSFGEGSNNAKLFYMYMYM